MFQMSEIVFSGEMKQSQKIKYKELRDCGMPQGILPGFTVGLAGRF